MFDVPDIDARGARPVFFENPETDALMTALLEVMSQLWVNRDYTLALEKALVERGVLPNDAVSKVRWTDEEQAASAKVQNELLRDAMRAVGVPLQRLSEREAEIDSFQQDLGA